MQIHKFGGASVKDAESVMNVGKVLATLNEEPKLIVVSAMGKTTNALEDLLKIYFDGGDYEILIHEIQKSHLEIADQLLQESSDLRAEIVVFFEDLRYFLRKNKSKHYDFVYDQVVSCGEMISSKILAAYLRSSGLSLEWLDARDYIKTDATYREALVNWPETIKKISQLKPNNTYITQGFIASNQDYLTTTLGREGSDYSAAIFAYGLGANSLSIWKDVPGVLNGDPRYFDHCELLEQISYEEAIELAYYGASVIHPKTLQPLKIKEIPFHVRSFKEPKSKGTFICNGQKIKPLVPCKILKQNQCLLTLQSIDFSFITSGHLGDLFAALHRERIKVNMIHNSAVSLSLCLEDKYNGLQNFLDEFSQIFKITTEPNVSLFTVRHFTEDIKKELESKGEVLLKQTREDVYQVVIKTPALD